MTTGETNRVRDTVAEASQQWARAQHADTGRITFEYAYRNIEDNVYHAETEVRFVRDGRMYRAELKWQLDRRFNVLEGFPQERIEEEALSSD